MLTFDVKLVIWYVRRADDFTTFMCQLSGDLGTSTYRNPMGLTRSEQGFLYLFLLKSKWLYRFLSQSLFIPNFWNMYAMCVILFFAVFSVCLMTVFLCVRRCNLMNTFLNYWAVLLFCSNWIRWRSFPTLAPGVVYSVVKLEHLDRLADISDRVWGLRRGAVHLTFSVRTSVCVFIQEVRSYRGFHLLLWCRIQRQSLCFGRQGFQESDCKWKIRN